MVRPVALTLSKETIQRSLETTLKQLDSKTPFCRSMIIQPD